MQLSILIVNYNVKYFLEQCLCSVQQAIQGLAAEVIVVDNASTDGSLELLQPQFGWVRFIASATNTGFAPANNLALQYATGDYILYLNPDTILAEDSLAASIRFLDEHPQAGGLGIKMVDGAGRFLPESKRSFPSPLTSLYKLMGLGALFPKSPVFARYSLGHLSPNSNHEVGVLSGAYLMSRRVLLQQLGGFDEAFFMYGEDVDLSYRIQQAGYKNYYFAGSTIIHFKGESTKKGSLNYVKMFYNAMSLFVQKHYGSSRGRVFAGCIRLAIWLRAGVTAVKKVISMIGTPFPDAVLVLGAFILVCNGWVQWVRHGEPFLPMVQVGLPAFALLFIITAYFSGMYDEGYRPRRALYPSLVAIVVGLAAYSLLPEKFRFSRGVVVVGGLMAMMMLMLLRWLVGRWWPATTSSSIGPQQTLVVGSSEAYNRVVTIYKNAGIQHRLLGRVAPGACAGEVLGSIDQLPDIVKRLQPREVVFCGNPISYSQIIELIQRLPRRVKVRFHGFCTQSIVGSDSKDTGGAFYTNQISYELQKAYQLRRKRTVDLIIATGILLCFPVFLMAPGWGIIKNALAVITGKKTWVGYATPNALPPLRPGVIHPGGAALGSASLLSPQALLMLDDHYARTYDWMYDLRLITTHLSNLAG